jgi:glycosyltransferase involved in cell wall biosynthesis
VMKALRERLPVNARRRLLRSGVLPKADLFHAMNQRVEAGRARIPVVVTFHDLFVLTGEYSTAEFRRRFAEQARVAAARADRIIAVSEFTASQVHDLLGVERDRIRVVHHGTEMPPGEPRPDGGRENLILHVGAIQKRKNLIRLIEAFEQTGQRDWKLVLAGSDGYEAAEVRARIGASPIADRISIAGYVSHHELEELFKRARIFAFPSLDEGFGIPVIEAMARAVPVLTSNRSALPEAAGGAALLVDPLEVGAIAQGLKTLMADPQARTELSRRGRERARGMTWERAAGETWGVYEELAG